jgi:tRNA (cytosine49-C5)-methyltransferase
MVKGRHLPEAFLEKLRKLIPLNQWDKVSKSFNAGKPTTFRVNTLKTNASSIREKLTSQGFKMENVLWAKDAFILRKGLQKDLEKTDPYQKGDIYIQGLSSMIPPLALNPQPGELVLDLTAAPGSKTTQMASLMKGLGQIVACDNNPIRVEKLRANVDRQGATLVNIPDASDGGLFWKNHFEVFDRVLLDAPCSSEGRFQLDEPSTYGYWRKETNRKMAKDQRRLFKSAFYSLKPGGTMVYSTCTFAPEENEMVLDWALETYGDALEIEDIPLSLPATTRGLSGWDGVKFHPSVIKALRILPTADMEGFFAARLKKTKSVPAPPPLEFEVQSKNEETPDAP